METALIVFAVLFAIAGLIGCVMPALPGPPLSYIALLFLQWTFQPFSITFLVIFGIITIVVSMFDYLVPVWTGRRYGASRYGVWGSIIGMSLGILLTPIGMVMGLLLGAIIGELIYGRTVRESLRSGIGTLLGTLITIAIKVALSGTMTIFMIVKLGAYFSRQHALSIVDYF